MKMLFSGCGIDIEATSSKELMQFTFNITDYNHIDKPLVQQGSELI